MKWRKIKKKFKKVKPTMIGRIMCATGKDGSRFWMKIAGVKIYPAGGNKLRYDYTAEPYEPPQMQHSSKEQGFSLTFNVTGEKLKKRISDFVKRLEK